MRPSRRSPDVSVVIPSYNSAEWLPSTLDALRIALERTAWSAEVIVVDDGSTDDSVAVLSRLADNYPHELRLVTQENGGVFLAVWEGLSTASAEAVLILNSRLLLHEDSLSYLERNDALTGESPWNGHVVTDPAASLVGRFWEVPTAVFWGGYLANPRPTRITSANFDRVPKGTGCLLISRDLMMRAYRACWPAQNAQFTSDDTRLLRFVVGVAPMTLDPGFSATYRPRTTVRRFLAHARNRGSLFVDSYAGTSVPRNAVLVLLVVAPPLLLAGLVAGALLGAWQMIAALLVAAAIGIAAPAAIALARRAPLRAVLSYLAYVLPFGFVFWLGLARGLRIHRSAFRRVAPRGAQ